MEDPYLTDLFIVDTKPNSVEPETGETHETGNRSPGETIAETLTMLDKEPPRQIDQPESESFNARYTRAPDEVEIQYHRGAFQPGRIPDDVWIYRYVVIFLSVVAGGSLIGCIFLSVKKIPVPDYLIVSGSGAIGAMSGLLTPVPRKSRHDE